MSSNERAEALLEAHVAHEVSRLRSQNVERVVEEFGERVLAWFSDIRLDEVSSPERVMGVIDRIVIDLHVGGGITELAGEMARLVLTSPANTQATVGEVISAESLEDFSEKILDLREVGSQLLGTFVRSAPFADVAARVASRALTDTIHRAFTAVTPSGVIAAVAQLEGSARTELERRITGLLAQRVESRREVIAQAIESQLAEVLDRDTLQSIVDGIWAEFADQRLDRVFAHLGEADLEDFVIFIYDFWLRFRRTPYFRRIAQEVTERVFVKYGREPVSVVIEDLGVPADLVIGELKASLVPWIERARDTGFAEAWIRDHLRDFYASDACVALLGDD